MNRPPDFGEVVIALLAGILESLGDRLAHDGFEAAADVVADLVDVADDYLINVVGLPRSSSGNLVMRR